MVQRGRGARFLLEAAEAIAVGRKRGRQHLERHVAIEARVVGTIDLAHAAAADQALDFVRAEPGAWREGHGGAYRPPATSMNVPVE